MRLRSRGLGRKELVMDFREYEVVRQGDEIVIVGTIRDPVNWDFSIRVCEDDLPGLARFAVNGSVLGLVLRSLFRRNRGHHWTQERSEHLAEGKARLETTRKKARERARASVEPLGSRSASRPRNSVAAG